ELRTAEYWVRHVREAVRFHDAIQTLEREGVRTYVELGPDSILSALGEHCVTDAVFAPALRAGRPEAQTLTTALAQAHVRGADVDWEAFFAGTGARRTELPTYAFQRQRYWPEEADADASAAQLGAMDAEFWDLVEREDIDALTATLGVDGDLPLSFALSAMSEWARGRRAEQSSAADGEAAPEAAGPAGPPLRERLAPLTENEREKTLLALVRTEAAAVLGYPGPEDVDPGQAFRDLGLDSLTAVQLRNRLAELTGLTLPASLVYDQPTPVLLVSHLRGELASGDAANPATTVLDELDRLEAALAASSPDGVTRARIQMRLQALATRWSESQPLADSAPAEPGEVVDVENLDSVSDEELFAFIDDSLA
ncbi:phosphopantetheine-binding protein, partial [Kitasatospora sp. NPDC001175]|uniref:phosphopantetheine-binding protein n=1 Tax=Kitasatospora sp. NPDC001175 TaxID=3157103 RepID=UPI003D080AA8